MRQGRLLALVTICAVALVIGGCGGDDADNGGSQTNTTQGQSPAGGATQAPAQPQAPAQSAPPTGGTSGGISSPADVAAIAEQNRQTLTQMNQGKEVAAVTTDTIQGLLPEKLAGMNRTDVSAERNQTMGVDLTTGEATYEGPNDASLDLRITDVGNMTGPMRMGLTAWTMTQYNRQASTGYEKTGTYSGYKGMEEYDNESKSGTVRVFVADRFIIEVNGNNVPMDLIKQALGQIDLKKVATLASGS